MVSEILGIVKSYSIFGVNANDVFDKEIERHNRVALSDSAQDGSRIGGNLGLEEETLVND